jgi:Cu-processing system ATP-binding protein
MRNPVVELQGVGKRYRDKDALLPLDLQVAAGESLVLIGHNGAGKTTLMKLLLGLSRPTRGRLSVLGVDPWGTGAAGGRATVGYLPENVAFSAAMTGREVLAFYARLKGVPVSDCAALLRTVGLQEEAWDRRVGTYSKGMRQRLGLAQAMLGQPRLLILDEPTTGLDPSLRHQFYGLLAGLREQGVTLLISSHALNEVEAHADRIAILRRGELVACGTLDALKAAVPLPVRMRVSVAPGQAGAVAGGLPAAAATLGLNGRHLELRCPDGDKMAVIRYLGGLGDLVHNLEMMPPRLEQIYNHYVNGAAS